MSSAFHLAIFPARGPVRYHLLNQGTTTIGSAPDRSLVIPDPDLAPAHARIELRGASYVLVREASSVLVNGRRAKAHLLAPYDLLVMGKNALSFRPGPPPAAADGVDLEPIKRLHAFADCVRAREEPRRLADQLVSDLLALTGAQRGTLVRLSADDDPTSLSTATQGDIRAPEFAYSRTLVERMRNEGKAIFVEDTQRDPELREAQSILGPSSLSAIAVPLVADGRILGALYVSGKSGLRRSSLELLELYANHATFLLESERRERALVAQLEQLGEAEPDDSLLIGVSAPVRAVRKTLRKVAASRTPVLLTGETGTGKEIVAREIHRIGPRARGPFVALNCGAIPHDLLASELFGHVRGAFSQAHRDRDGVFRSAQGGTLLLDEIGEMPLAQQVALLRVLQEGCVTPVGSEKSIALDVRVIFATNRALENDVASGRFRQDLFFRIAALTIVLPPLRERRGDIVLLAHHFLRGAAREQNASDLRFSDEALAALQQASWEGNVRQLEASVRRAVLLRETSVLTPEDLGLSGPSVAQLGATEVIRPLAMARDEFLRAYVRGVVDRMGGNRTAAAEAMMVTPRTVFKYMEE